jgi:acyl-[acyl-carrier-protein]-phospholipid O-acyltransferase/long-chain-fatty-acid--[acyl-carrier-protein] ligase
MAAAIGRGIGRSDVARISAKAGIRPPGMLYLGPARTDVLRQAAWPWRQRPPAALITRLLVPKDADSLATVIFSSGSTGVPKGVMLSHHNIRANIASAMQVFELGGKDVMLGVLPFFHSFGFTVTLWLPLVSGFASVYHPNPMDAKTIGELAHRYRGTVLVSTPTFCLAYVRKTEAAHFAHLRYAVVGAERLRDPIAAAFKEKFGVDLTEGYGCTEMAPVVAANLNPIRRGSVGRPLPGIDARVVDAGNRRGTAHRDRRAALLVSGPNRMIGYLGEPERTHDAFRGD